ncbi:MAG: ABC transporter transmembrane domain-containing protein [Merdibacter sp.]
MADAGAQHPADHGAHLLLAALLSGAQLSSGAIGIVIDRSPRHRPAPYLGVLAAISSERASHAVKQQLREKIYRKLLSLGGSYHERVSTSEIVQVSVEGVDQLETYFSSYLPQFFYSMLAPVTLFVALVFVNWKAAVVLFVCVPLIPVSIAAAIDIRKSCCPDTGDSTPRSAIIFWKTCRG